MTLTSRFCSFFPSFSASIQFQRFTFLPFSFFFPFFFYHGGIYISVSILRDVFSFFFLFPPFFFRLFHSRPHAMCCPHRRSLFFIYFFLFGISIFISVIIPFLYYIFPLQCSRRPCARIIQHSPWRPYIWLTPLSLVELKIWFQTTSFLFLLLYCSFRCCYMPVVCVCVVFIRLKKLAIQL